MYGWRARIGVIIPSANTTVEPEFGAFAPTGVSVHASRVRSFGVTPEGMEKMLTQVDRAADELVDAAVDVIVFACTSGSFTQAPDHGDRLQQALSDRLGIPVVSTTSAVIAACRKLGMSRLLLASPYTEAVNRQEAVFLAHYGLDVVAHVGLGHALPQMRLPLRSAPASLIGLEPAHMSYALAKRLAEEKGTQDLFLSCTNFRTFETIPLLERDLGIRVVSSNQASLWAGLTLARACDPAPALGSLFATAEPADIRLFAS